MTGIDFNADYGFAAIISKEAYPYVGIFADAPALRPAGDHAHYLTFSGWDVTYTLTQRGDVPADAFRYSLQSAGSISDTYYSGIYKVTMNGIDIEIVPHVTSPHLRA